MGPGIVRILAEYPEIQLENDASAKEFKVIIKRIIQKREVATQKRETATQKGQFEDIDTTQKRESATQNGQFEDIDTTQKKEIATQKNLNTTQKKVLEYFKDNPKATRVDAANALGNITEDGVKFIIAKLQKKGLLKRVGGRKYGEWLVFISNKKEEMLFFDILLKNIWRFKNFVIPLLHQKKH